MDDVAGTGISLTQIVTALVVLAVGIGLALAVHRLVVRRFRGSDSSPGAARLIARLIQLVIIAAALIYVLNTLGVRITPLLGALGIGGIALALAVQSMLSNAVASVLLQVRRPFRIGDQIVTNDIAGKVLDIDLRTVRLLTFDGNDMLVPAAMVLDAPITNWTRRATRRTQLDVGVDYATDLELACRTILEAMNSVPGVQTEPAPEAWVFEFGDSTINIAARFWHEAPVATMWQVRSEVAVGIKAALDAEGIEIAFPQRVLHIVPPDSEKQGS
ncbi:mechanosensitive ion channel family protein [Aeromicrobium sp. A1-2]|uniref:mechanosensitive ion channel family protein n=1 Tax=Aeromicrobium sp. A1-2 TaxID=2107713 RepID=UPI0013C2A3B3|nr:mechanosensitive ion channel family protein [Aeromicrobium sp. A1-2]